MIETHELGKRFQEFWAVDGLDLNVGAGQVLALLGQNGAGKTTTVRMLSALLSPTRGSASIAGFDVARSGSQVRRVVGVLTEQHGLYGRMTAHEYLDFFAQLHRLPQPARAGRIDFLLGSFGLARVREQRIGEYSKGMRQKLALARALIHEPPVLLLDEPTSAMDPESSRLVRDEISRLRSAKRSIVICTHNLAEAEALADSVAIIFQGKILVQGTLAELRLKVLGAAEYEARYGSEWEPEALELPDGVAMTYRDNTTMRFRVENPQTANPLLMRALVARNAPLMAFQELQQTLEAVYLRAMQGARLAVDGTPERND
jgi:ABC-2 type transport system ATP-binding protein